MRRCPPVLFAVSLAAACMVIACGGSSNGWTYAEPTPLSSEPRDRGERADPPEPDPDPSEAPRIELDALLEYEGPAPTTGMPARAGDRVALPVVDNDTARGNPNLTVRIVHAHSGDTLWEQVVQTPEEFARAESPQALRESVEPRVRAAQARLDEGGFAPLTAIYVPETPGDGEVEATGAGVVLRWDPETRVLRLRDADDDAVLARHPLAPAEPTEAGEACPDAHAPLLRGAWIDSPDGVLVIRVAFVGNDACWPPSDRWLVFPLGEDPDEEQPPADSDDA